MQNWLFCWISGFDIFFLYFERNKMKKLILLFGALLMFCSVSSANDDENCAKMHSDNNYGCEKGCQKEIKKDNCKAPCDKEKHCKKSYFEQEIDDDEYCTYNQCFFDKKYRKLKTNLCLTQRQEICLDNYYRNFKAEMENYCAKYRNCKNELLEDIVCEKNCYKDKKHSLKEIKKDAKEKCKDFRDEINDLLCKKQRKAFKKFLKNEKQTFKKVVKYAYVYKFPCVNCCNND